MTAPLHIDQEFKSIIPPLSESEHELLEESLKHDGCREPICIWNGVIVDGHNRYEICTRLGIPYSTILLSFPSRADAISWICLNQLSRRNLNGEAFRYLIGKRYDAEKIIAQRKNANGINQFTKTPEDDQAEPDNESWKAKTDSRTSARIGQQYNLNHTTIESYGRFSRSLDQIERKAPGLLPDVLAGSIRISKDTVDMLADMPDEEVHHISKALRDQLGQNRHMTVYDTNRVIKKVHEQENGNGDDPVIIPRIKTMPVYDPDAEVNGLLLTIPTWVSTIQRISQRIDFSQISDKARCKLNLALHELESVSANLQQKAGGQDSGD